MLRTVANLTRADGEEFMALAPQVPVRTNVEALPLEQANEALDRLRAGKVTGALALVPLGRGTRSSRSLVLARPALAVRQAVRLQF